jgi:hypothetical protein
VIESQASSPARHDQWQGWPVTYGIATYDRLIEDAQRALDLTTPTN